MCQNSRITKLIRTHLTWDSRQHPVQSLCYQTEVTPDPKNILFFILLHLSLSFIPSCSCALESQWQCCPHWVKNVTMSFWKAVNKNKQEAHKVTK